VNQEFVHQPVLLNEVLNFFNPQPNQNFIDATINEAGHTLPILERIKPNGKLLGIDLNKQVLQKLEKQVNDDNLILVHGNFANLSKIVKKHNFENIAGVLFDLGLSSWLLEKSKRGFSFQEKDQPLDMRFDKLSSGAQAEDVLNQWTAKELAKAFVCYGEVKPSIANSIANAIIDKRPLKTTQDLTKLLFTVKTKAKVFQALRIIVNNELYNLEKAVKQAIVLSQKVAVISFHSLEDRIIKRLFKNKQLIKPSKEEIKANPRARSAKLRFYEKK